MQRGRVTPGPNQARSIYLKSLVLFSSIQALLFNTKNDCLSVRIVISFHEFVFFSHSIGSF
jgi:hypothetical protein